MTVRICRIFFCLLLAVGTVTVAAPEELRVGDRFPNLVFESLLEPEHYEALGLPQSDGPVRLEDVRGELLILEFFNKYCLTCWRQAPQLQTFSELLEPGDLGGRVHILSVGAGNSAAELQEFQREFRLTYPLAPDPEFEQFYRLDPGGAPWTAFLLRDGPRWVLADAHMGFYGDVELLARARTLLKGWPVRPYTLRNLGVPGEPPGSTAPLAERFAREVLGAPVEVTARRLDDGSHLHQVLGDGGSAEDVYIRVAYREPVCDLCHPVRFLIAFDGDGLVRGFAPVFVTKFGNEEWDREDVELFRRRLLGRSIHELHFDPEVDAVSSATMSSALIFAEVRRMGIYLRELTR